MQPHQQRIFLLLNSSYQKAINLMQKKKTSESEELYGELGHAFNFTQGDLEANRAGLISERQNEIQKEHVYWHFRFLLLVSIVMSIFWGYLFMVYFPASARHFLLPQVCIWLSITGIFSLLSLNAIAGAILYRYDSKTELNEGRVETASGQIVVVSNRGTVCVGDTKLNCTAVTYPYGDLSYVAYYLPKTKQIISVEELKAEQELSHAKEKE
jgi:hypothetical protein